MNIVSFLRAPALGLLLTGCAGLGPTGSANVDIADGDAAFARAQHAVAIDHYTRAIDSGRLRVADVLEAYAKRADAYVMESELNGGIDGNLVAALEDYSKVRAAVPRFQPAAMGLGHAYQALGAYDEALLAFKDAYALDEDRNHFGSLMAIGDLSDGGRLWHGDALLRPRSPGCRSAGRDGHFLPPRDDAVRLGEIQRGH